MTESLFADSREVHTFVDTRRPDRKVADVIDASVFQMPVEFTHTKQCLGASLIATVENFRDDESIGFVGFAIAAQDGTFYHMAMDYLVDGLMPCACPVSCVNDLPPWLCSPSDECRACINTTFVESHREYREAADFVGTTPYIPFSPAEVIEEIAHYLRGNQL